MLYIFYGSIQLKLVMLTCAAIFLSLYPLKTLRIGTSSASNQGTTLSLSISAATKAFDPILQGWLNYYGGYYRSGLYQIWRHFNKTLVAWAVRKYKNFRQRKTWASKFLEKISENKPRLFVHWRNGMQGAFA
jgi:hypothetical protein